MGDKKGAYTTDRECKEPTIILYLRLRSFLVIAFNEALSFAPFNYLQLSILQFLLGYVILFTYSLCLYLFISSLKL